MKVSGQLHFTAALYPQEEPPGHVEDEARWGPRTSMEVSEKRKKTLASLGFRTPGLSTPQLSHYAD